MKLLALKFKIIIGVLLFIVLVCAGYCTTIFNSSSENNYNKKIGQVEYKGQFLMPVENFQVVTSKYGARIHPISRQTKLSFRD